MTMKNKRYWGCLDGYILIIITVLVMILFFIITIKVSSYIHRHHPPFADKIFIESFAGLEFPNYSLVGTDKYLCHAYLRFDSIPDKPFFDKLDSLTNTIYVCKRDGNNQSDTLQLWFYNDSLNYYYLMVQNYVVGINYEENPLMVALVNQGVPESFFHQRPIQLVIRIWNNRPEWEIEYY